jgi:flagellar protein FlaG
MNTIISSAAKLSEAAAVESFVPMSSNGLQGNAAVTSLKGFRAVEPGKSPEPSDRNLQQPGIRDEQEAQQTAELLNEYMDDLQTNLGFSIRKDLNNQIVVQIKNRKTDELIRQIPTEEMVAIKKKMEELTGMLFDEKV